MKFVEKISKQEKLNASSTTDYNFFYWNKKSKSVLKGFEAQRKKTIKIMENSISFIYKRMYTYV